jgi:hypothetical protein
LFDWAAAGAVSGRRLWEPQKTHFHVDESIGEFGQRNEPQERHVAKSSSEYGRRSDDESCVGEKERPSGNLTRERSSGLPGNRETVDSIADGSADLRCFELLANKYEFDIVCY